MRLPFLHGLFPSNAKTDIPVSRRRQLTKVRTLWIGTYVLLFAALLLWYPRKVLTHFKTDDFHVTRDDAPVLNDTGDIRFSNTPVSSLRPQNQFFSHGGVNSFAVRVVGEQPILTIITVTRDAREVIRHTARFILEQSLIPIRWLIVNDHTAKRSSYALLQEIASLDRRFSLVNSSREPGFSNGRIHALNCLSAAPTKYFAFLDDDDYFEYTAYEKCLWMLESNVNVSMCGTFVIGFGERNYTWQHGFHSGYKVVVNNPLTGSEVLRASVLVDADCGFDESLQTGMEDWDFYLCLASRGFWGATIPEHLFWYRINPESLRKTRWGSLFDDREKISKEIRNRYKELEDKFPKAALERTTEFETMKLSLPFKNQLYLKKSILFIIPWMTSGGGDTANLRLVQELSWNGYRVTIVCTLLNPHDNSMTSLPLFMQYTHDVFTLPAMIRLADAPRFLAYLIESRNVETVLISNSRLGYGVLPWLSAKYRDVTFVDYVHNEEPTWKNGGYAAFSTMHQTSLDATFASSEGARQYMIQQGHDPSTVQVGYLGIDLNHLHPLQYEEQTAARLRLGIPADATVVIYIARRIEHKQPKVAASAFLNIARETRDQGAESMSNKLRLLMIGDGPVMHEVKEITTQYGDLVMMLGNLRPADARKYLEVSDIFCFPSTAKGVSWTLSESMALGAAALTSSVGGFSKMLKENDSYRVIVDTVRNTKKDVEAVAEQMRKLIGQASLRKERGHRSSTNVRHFSDAHHRISEFVRRILKVKRRRRHNRAAHSELSALHYTQLTVLKEVGVFSDFPEIHRTLLGKERGEYGTKYRAVCGEHNESQGRLIDMLENPKPCQDGEELDVESMRSAALAQCGRWCIMNPDDPNFQSGWQAKENCQGFSTFNDPAHKCATWYKSLST